MNKIFFALPLLVLLFHTYSLGVIHTVTGKITDEQNKPIAGATIMEKGSSTGVTTDGSGNFKINVAGKNAVLVISAVGYQQNEIAVKGRTGLKIKLAATNNRLEEVVVTGYGRQVKTKMTANAPLAYTTAGIAADANGYYKHYPDTQGEFNTEDYDGINENKFLKATDNPLSTFSIDVDAASYSNVRRFLNMGQLPPAGAVRTEEMINYFSYQYPQPKGDDPFSINTEMAVAPWNKEHKLVLIGLQGKKISTDKLPSSNLVFLIDVSGSMGTPNKLPLVKASMKMLVDQLREEDNVAMVVYAGAAGLVLPPTRGSEKTTIKDAIDRLESGGSTAGGAGLKLAYKTAKENFLREGNNRVILCTDGDFNIGESSDDAMERLIEEERKSGVFLTVLGYGMGNYKDNKMQKLADKGNGNHAYIDGISEAKKVLVNEFGGTLFTIAKDVKLQIEFNPAFVQAYRLIGYENRMLAKEDFNDDKKDAGELGSGHTVTALYEIIPVGVKSDFVKNVDPLKYQPAKLVNGASKELLTVKFRYKAPDGDKSKLIEHSLPENFNSFEKSSSNFRFAASVAEFAMLLRDSEFKSASSFDQVISIAKGAKGEDEEGYRAEFIKLVKNAEMLAKGRKDSKKEELVDIK